MEVITSFKPTGNYIYDKQVLVELYETKFGIHDHIKAGGPLSSVSINEKEIYTKDFLYESYLRTFIYKDIGKKLSISFDDYINRPRYEIDSINRIVEEIEIKRNEVNRKALANIEDVTKDSDIPKDFEV